MKPNYNYLFIWIISITACKNIPPKYYLYYSIVDGALRVEVDTTKAVKYFEIQTLDSNQDILVVHNEQKVEERILIFKDDSTYFYSFQPDAYYPDAISGYTYYVRYGRDSVAMYTFEDNAARPIYFRKTVLSQNEICTSKGKLNLTPTFAYLKRHSEIFELLKTNTLVRYLKVENVTISHYKSELEANKEREKIFSIFH